MLGTSCRSIKDWFQVSTHSVECWSNKFWARATESEDHSGTVLWGKKYPVSPPYWAGNNHPFFSSWPGPAVCTHSAHLSDDSRRKFYSQTFIRTDENLFILLTWFSLKTLEKRHYRSCKLLGEIFLCRSLLYVIFISKNLLLISLFFQKEITEIREDQTVVIKYCQRTKYTQITFVLRPNLVSKAKDNNENTAPKESLQTP